VYRHVLILESQGFGSNQPQQLLGGSPKANPDRHIPNTLKTLGKHRKVRFLSSLLKKPGYPRVFRISCQFLWLSCLSMHVPACRCCVVLCAAMDPGESSCESRALPKVPGTNSGPAWASFASIPGRFQRCLAPDSGPAWASFASIPAGLQRRLAPDSGPIFTLQNGFSSMIFQSTAPCMNCLANWIRLWIVVLLRVASSNLVGRPNSQGEIVTAMYVFSDA
jgi:hypothetical protein